MSHIFGCKQTPATPPTTSEESSGSSDDAEAKKKRGNRAMGKKKFPKAVKYYTKAIKIDPGNATYHLNRAIANATLELWKAAEADAARAVDLGSPPSAKAHYQLARARLRRGRLEEARDAANAGLAAFPGEAALSQLLQEIERERARLEAKRRKEAEVAAARPPTAAGPSGARALLDQARSLYSAGKLEEAVAQLKEARTLLSADSGGSSVVLSPDAKKEDMGALSLLAKANMQLRRWPDAAEAFEALVALQEATFSMENKDERESLSNSCNNLGIAYKNAGRMSEAVGAMLKAYQRATNGDDKVATPQAAQILQNVGQCYRSQRKLDDALRFYLRALEIGQGIFPDDHASHALNYLCVARCHRDLGQVKQAVEAYTQAVTILGKKDPEECLREMPEVPNKERLAKLQEECRAELGQIVLAMEHARQQAATATVDPAADGEEPPAPPPGAVAAADRVE